MRYKPALIVLMTLLSLALDIYAIDFSHLKDKLIQKYPHIEMINVTNFHDEFHNKEYVLLDTRTQKEYAVSHLYGAYHAPNMKEALDILQGLDKQTPIITYCSLGYRSANLAEKLQKYGYSNVKNLTGSLFEWVDYSYPVYRAGQEVQQVHPFNLWWGRYLRRDYHTTKPIE